MINVDTIERKIKMVGVLKDGTEIQTELCFNPLKSGHCY